MNIVIVNQHPDDVLGGSEIQCDLLARGLAARGHIVSYVAASKYYMPRQGYPYDVCITHRDPDSIARTVISREPDVVYWRFNKRFFRSAVRRIRSYSVPVVFAVSHINDLEPWGVKPLAGKKAWLSSLARKVRARWEHGGYRFINAMTVNNREHLARAPIKDCTYIPNGMTVEATPFSWPRPYCAWVANLKAPKRPELAVRLAGSLEPKGIDLLMVGELQCSNYLWLKGRQYLPTNCHYLGPRSLREVNGILAGSLLHVHTCQPEGFSNVFIQAWLQGKASVSLGFDPCGYIREHSLGLVADDNERLFTNQVLALIDNDQQRLDSAERARTFASDTFSVATMVQRVEKLLLRVAHNSV